MHDEGFPCGAATYGGIMQAYGDRSEVMKAAELGARALAAEAPPAMATLNKLLAQCAAAAAKEAGVATFKLLQTCGWTPDGDSYAALIDCAAAGNDLGLAVRALEELAAAGLPCLRRPGGV